MRLLTTAILILFSFSASAAPNVILGEWTRTYSGDGVKYTSYLNVEETMTNFGLECAYEKVVAYSQLYLSTRIDGDNFIVTGSGASDGACNFVVSPVKLKFAVNNETLTLIYPDLSEQIYVRP